MNDPIAEQRDSALAELKLFRGKALRWTEAMEAWWINPSDVNAMVAQDASRELSDAFGAPMARTYALYQGGAIIRRPDLDLTEPAVTAPASAAPSERAISDMLDAFVRDLAEPIRLMREEAITYSEGQSASRELRRSATWEADRVHDARHDISRALQSRRRRG